MPTPPNTSPTPPEDPAESAARAYHAFENPLHDRFLGIILALGAEVWQLRERLSLLETALARQDMEVSALIEEMALDPERAPSTIADRDAFLARFLRAVSADEVHSVAAD